MITQEGTVVVRIDASFYSANTVPVKDSLENIERHAEGKLERVVLDASSINDIDSSAVHVLQEVVEEFERDGVLFSLAGVKGPVSDVLERAGGTQLARNSPSPIGITCAPSEIIFSSRWRSRT